MDNWVIKIFGATNSERRREGGYLKMKVIVALITVSSHPIYIYIYIYIYTHTLA